MWQNDIENYARQHGISHARARFFQCTGEHLMAHSDGGEANHKNIVAACKFCNTKRHARKCPPSPEGYMAHVKKRLLKGAWNTPLLS
ncbi:HNH endonuclease [Marinobacter sp.]|uniref:HNH endonuclease n=1 Tax=Marinobacter sp. TaxID=50741 RepID=UPI003A921D3B